MEFFVGAMTTLIGVISLNYFTNKFSKRNKTISFITRQSEIFHSVAPLLRIIDSARQKTVLNTQAAKFHDSRYTTVAVVDGKAYWIENNALLVADVVDGNFEKESAKRVDTMAMDKVELNKIMYIVEQLSEGTNNDRGNTGKP